jgi:hypothetical protein
MESQTPAPRGPHPRMNTKPLATGQDARNAAFGDKPDTTPADHSPKMASRKRKPDETPLRGDAEEDEEEDEETGEDDGEEDEESDSEDEEDSAFDSHSSHCVECVECHESEPIEDADGDMLTCEEEFCDQSFHAEACCGPRISKEGRCPRCDHVICPPCLGPVGLHGFLRCSGCHVDLSCDTIPATDEDVFESCTRCHAVFCAKCNESRRIDPDTQCCVAPCAEATLAGSRKKETTTARKDRPEPPSEPRQAAEPALSQA